MSSAADTGTLAEVLLACQPTIAPALIEPAAFAALQAQCRRLPIQCASFWGLESDLSTEHGDVDLLVEVKRGSQGHARLTGEQPSLIDPLCELSPAWRALRRFAAAWTADERGSLVRNVWIEFDLRAAAMSDPPADALLAPSVFWGPREVGRTEWSAFTALAALVGEAFDPFPRTLPLDALAAAVAGLPDGARLFQVGAMQARGDVVLRLCVNRLAADRVPDWLDAQGWRGDAGRLDDALRALAGMSRVIAIDLDYTAAGVGPKIGVECYQHWSSLSAADWQPLLDHVTALGLCRPAKRDALAAFPAATEFSVQEQMAKAADGLMFPVVYRNLHHIKLTFVGEAFRDAKAYLGVTRPGVRTGLKKIPDRIEPGGDGWIVD
jgi:hypothetical protein